METLVKETNIEDITKTTRTAATVYKDDLKIMKEIAQIKFDKDPMNSAWQEAVKLFIEANKDVYLKRYEEVK